MTSITCKNPDVLAALANIRQDEDNKCSNFENTVDFLLPTCPVVEKSNNKNRRVTHAEVETADGLTGTMKSDKGKKWVSTCDIIQNHSMTYFLPQRISN